MGTKVDFKLPENPSFALGNDISIDWVLETSFASWPECNSGVSELSNTKGVGHNPKAPVRRENLSLFLTQSQTTRLRRILDSPHMNTHRAKGLMIVILRHAQFQSRQHAGVLFSTMVLTFMNQDGLTSDTFLETHQGLCVRSMIMIQSRLLKTSAACLSLSHEVKSTSAEIVFPIPAPLKSNRCLDTREQSMRNHLSTIALEFSVRMCWILLNESIHSCGFVTIIMLD